MSDAGERVPEETGAAPVAVDAGCGAHLRLAREQRGLSLADVAQRLKYAARQVQALEEGRYDALPGLTFQRGFVRGYARLLGLDPNNMVMLFERECGQSNGPDTTQLQQIAYAAATLPTRTEHTTAWPWILATLLAVFGLGGYSLYKWEAPSNVSRAPSAAKTVGDFHSNSTPASFPAAQTISTSAASVQPVAEVAARMEAGERPVSLPGVSVEISTERQASPKSASGSGKIRLRFTGESWVEVRQGNGALVHSGTGVAGTERWVDGQGPFDLVIGNAAAVKLQFRGADVSLDRYAKGSVAKVQLQ